MRTATIQLETGAVVEVFYTDGALEGMLGGYVIRLAGVWRAYEATRQAHQIYLTEYGRGFTSRDQAVEAIVARCEGKQ